MCLNNSILTILRNRGLGFALPFHSKSQWALRSLAENSLYSRFAIPHLPFITSYTSQRPQISPTKLALLPPPHWTAQHSALQVHTTCHTHSNTKRICHYGEENGLGFHESKINIWFTALRKKNSSKKFLDMCHTNTQNMQNLGRFLSKRMLILQFL